MSTFQSFEEIDAWRESQALRRKVRAICKRPIARKDFAFTDQISRSARSIAANIAEGFEALTIPGFIAYLGIAKQSCGETRSHLYDALDEEYITQEEFDELADLTRKISNMIAKLIHYLQPLDQKQKRTLQYPQQPTKNEERKTKNEKRPNVPAPP